MLSCKQVSRLVSQAMEARLRWHQRLGVRIHLLYCVWCRRYASQIRFLRRATRELAETPAAPEAPRLSEEAKDQMRRRLQDAANSTPPPSR